MGGTWLDIRQDLLSEKEMQVVNSSRDTSQTRPGVLWRLKVLTRCPKSHRGDKTDTEEVVKPLLQTEHLCFFSLWDTGILHDTGKGFCFLKIFFGKTILLDLIFKNRHVYVLTIHIHHLI